MNEHGEDGCLHWQLSHYFVSQVNVGVGGGGEVIHSQKYSVNTGAYEGRNY